MVATAERKSIKERLKNNQKGVCSNYRRGSLSNQLFRQCLGSRRTTDGDSPIKMALGGSSPLQVVIPVGCTAGAYEGEAMSCYERGLIIGCRSCKCERKWVEEDRLWKSPSQGRVFDCPFPLEWMLVMGSSMLSREVIPSSVAYITACLELLTIHNYTFCTSHFLIQKSKCVGVYVLAWDNCFVGHRNLVCVVISISVIQMVKGAGKLVWALEVFTSKNISLSSSTNHSGINTHSSQQVSSPNLNENPWIPVVISIEDEKQKSQVASLNVQLEKIILESLVFKKSKSLMGCLKEFMYNGLGNSLKEKVFEIYFWLLHLVLFLCCWLRKTQKFCGIFRPSEGNTPNLFVIAEINGECLNPWGFTAYGGMMVKGDG